MWPRSWRRHWAEPPRASVAGHRLRGPRGGAVTRPPDPAAPASGPGLPGKDHCGWSFSGRAGSGGYPRPEVFVKRKHIWLPGNPHNLRASGRPPAAHPPGSHGGCPASHDRASSGRAGRKRSRPPGGGRTRWATAWPSGRSPSPRGNWTRSSRASKRPSCQGLVDGSDHHAEDSIGMSDDELLDGTPGIESGGSLQPRTSAPACRARSTGRGTTASRPATWRARKLSVGNTIL